MNRVAIVLCGGVSERMGVDKASLPFGETTMLARTVERLSGVVDHIVIVTAPDGDTPELSSVASISITHDATADRGPAEGLAAGLAALPSGTDAVFVSSCDLPLLMPAFVERMFSLVDDTHDIIVPRHDERLQPLAAVYRPTVMAVLRQRLADDRLSMNGLLDACHTRIVDHRMWDDIDPQGHSLLNCNTKRDYKAALRIAGLL